MLTKYLLLYLFFYSLPTLRPVLIFSSFTFNKLSTQNLVSVSKGKPSATPPLLLATVLNKERSQVLRLKRKKKINWGKKKRRRKDVHHQALVIARYVVSLQVNKLPKLPIQRYTSVQQEKKKNNVLWRSRIQKFMWTDGLLEADSIACVAAKPMDSAQFC